MGSVFRFEGLIERVNKTTISAPTMKAIRNFEKEHHTSKHSKRTLNCNRYSMNVSNRQTVYSYRQASDA